MRQYLTKKHKTVLVVACVAGLLATQALPVLAVWDDANDKPVSFAQIDEYCSRPRIIAGGKGFGIVGAYSSKERYTICLDACDKIPASEYQTQENAPKYENLCCSLPVMSTALAVLTISVMPHEIGNYLKSLSSYGSMEKKCKEASFHSGSGQCVIHDDRPDGIKDCCLEKSERETSFGQKCAIQKFSGTDECKADGVFSCCVCKGKDGRKALAAGGEVKNCSACKKICEDPAASGVGEGGSVSFDEVAFSAGGCKETKDSFSGMDASQRAKYQRGTRVRGEDVNIFCWTAKECASENGKFRSGEGCANKGKEQQGKCEAPEPDYTLQFPVMGATTIKGLRSYIGLLFNAIIALAVVAAATMFVYGAFKYMVSSVGAQIGRAKETMIDALVGLVLALGSYAILANVAPNTLNLTTFKIDMINRLSFYNVVYCSDIKAGPGESALTFQDAGTPTVPITFSVKEGYPIAAAETACGHEYYISGSGQDSLCTGQKCKTGLCLNCASALASGCKTQSSHEFGCASGKMGGNIILSNGFSAKDVYLKVFCRWKNGSSIDAIEEDVDHARLKTSDVGTSGAAGKVGGYSFNNLNKGKSTVQEVIAKCKSHGQEALATIIFIGNSDVSVVQGLSLAVPVFGVPYIAADRLMDYRWIINKSSCGKNIADGGVYYYTGGLFSSFQGFLEEGNAFSPKDYWTAQDILKLIDEDKDVSECAIKMLSNK